MDRLRAVGALASGFSHEFATPLNTIKLRLERLARNLGEVNADLKTAQEAAEQCERALRSFNDSRIQSENLSLTTVHLPSLVHEIAESWKFEKCKSESKKENRRFVMMELLPCIGFEVGSAQVLLPRAVFSQILLNLLDNCWEAKTEDLRIQIEFIAETEYHCLRIKDNGPGISDLVFKQWGEPFVTTKSTGTGLGLFNALSLAQAIGGDFKISNLDAGGACVEFRLPISHQPRAATIFEELKREPLETFIVEPGVLARTGTKSET